jgi:hypothetical protein
MLQEDPSDREALAYACWELSQQTYRAHLSVGQTWQEAERKSRQWSLIGKAGVLFSVDEAWGTDGQDHLVAPLEFAWQGDAGLIGSVIRDLGFDIAIVEQQTDARWQRLTVSPRQGESASQILGKQTALDTVVKINNARRRNEMVCCQLEGDTRTHIVLLARRQQSVFQVRLALDGEWHNANPRLVWRIQPKQQKRVSQPA